MVSLFHNDFRKPNRRLASEWQKHQLPTSDGIVVVDDHWFLYTVFKPTAIEVILAELHAAERCSYDRSD